MEFDAAAEKIHFSRYRRSFGLQRFHECALFDWGTSNLRAWILNADGEIERHIKSCKGADQLSSDQFYGITRDILHDLHVKSAPKIKIPVIMCGMVGSRTGWVEAGYLPTPVHCQQIPQRPSHIETDDLNVFILPGLAVQRQEVPDILRGEETQILGFYMQRPDFRGLVCLPGTHSKWVALNAGMVESFRTAMTGELFSLLAQHSVIRHVIGQDSAFPIDHPGFKTGILEGFHHPERIIFDLFSIRAGGILLSRLGAEASARLSGLLIGAEISCALKDNPSEQNIALLAAGRLALLYKLAFEYIEVTIDLYDADYLVQDGLKFAAKQIF